MKVLTIFLNNNIASKKIIEETIKYKIILKIPPNEFNTNTKIITIKIIGNKKKTDFCWAWVLFSALNENFTVKVRHRNITTGPNIKQQIIVLIDGSITPRLLNNDIILIENKTTSRQ